MKDIAESKIDRFTRLVTAGIEAWVEAGQILNELVEEDINAAVEIMDRIPWMTSELVDAFRRIGRKEIYPHLLLDRSAGARALIALPYEEQQRLFTSEIAVAVMRRGEITVTHKRIQELTPRETDIVFNGSQLRPIADQQRLLRPRIPERSVVRTTRIEEPESPASDEPQESLEDDPTETPEQHLAAAQGHLIRARELMDATEAQKHLGQYVVQALNAIGSLRFKLRG